MIIVNAQNLFRKIYEDFENLPQVRVILYHVWKSIFIKMIFHENITALNLNKKIVKEKTYIWIRNKMSTNIILNLIYRWDFKSLRDSSAEHLIHFGFRGFNFRTLCQAPQQIVANYSLVPILWIKSNNKLYKYIYKTTINFIRIYSHYTLSVLIHTERISPKVQLLLPQWSHTHRAYQS